MLNRVAKVSISAVVLGISRLAFGNPALTTLLNFDTNNGGGAASGVTADSAGNLFGSTKSGGANNFGTFFELSGTSHQTLTTLMSFSNTGNGRLTANPSNLTFDAGGNLYGAADSGGATNDFGAIFQLSGASHQNITPLASFNLSNGAHPWGLTFDTVGNLYGTTNFGGTSDYGTVFELSGVNHQNINRLASFNKSNGADPNAGLVIDSAGNLYGTTWLGGSDNDGTVFELSGPNHQTITTLVNFNDASGSQPTAGLTTDSAGNIYGTTWFGGSHDDGTVFELSGPGHMTLTTLWNFQGVPAGSAVAGGLLIDAAGNLFGTTEEGGLDQSSGVSNQGTIFEIPGPDHQTLITLASFNRSDGALPIATLTADGYGNLYGTTTQGGTGSDGTVFELTGAGFVVPEPATLSLLTLAPLALLRRRVR